MSLAKKYVRVLYLVNMSSLGDTNLIALVLGVILDILAIR